MYAYHSPPARSESVIGKYRPSGSKRANPSGYAQDPSATWRAWIP